MPSMSSTTAQSANVETEHESLVQLLLHPKSVAMIGASTNPNALGGRPLGFLASYGFAGNVYPVNATHAEVQGRKAYASILDVPEAVDVAMVAVRAELVPGILRDCAAAGVRLAIVMSSGFGEGMGAGADLSAQIEEFAATTPMRILGPNCEGVASLPALAPLTFSPALDIARTGNVLRSGHIAIVSQSGGLGFAVAQWGTEVGLGFNYIVSTGNELDIDALEVATDLVEDPDTQVVVLLVEGFRDAERFAAVGARFAELGKSMVVAKLGRSVPGTRGARAHTGHDSGDQSVYASLFEEHGVLQAGDEEELIDLLQALSKAPRMKGRRLGVMTTSGGAGVWLSDSCAAVGLDLPILSEATQKVLATHMPGFGSPVNPVDLTAQFITGGAFAPAMDVLLSSGEVDAVILATSLSSSGRLEGDRDALAALIARFPDKPIFVYTYTKPAQSCVDILDELKLPWFTSSARAARGLAALMERS
jgi:acyl-CoA synthetase (NDP forming)